MAVTKAGKKLIAGNWKMNGGLDDARQLIADIVNMIDQEQDILEKAEFLVCPPFVHISAVRHAIHNFPHVLIGAQDCSAFENGAHTGDVSAQMLKDALCDYVILGHSERRDPFGGNESSFTVSRKAELAHAAGLKTIICVGETEDERALAIEKAIVEIQLVESLPESATAENTVIAYEPVWAIGTGNTATPGDAREMHDFIRGKLKERLEDSEKLRILYGGSMKPGNASDLLALENVDGGLIGGASLKAKDFIDIAKKA